MDIKRKVTMKTIVPVYGVIPNTPIIGYVRSLDLTTDQIRKCIVQKAVVDEILEDGSYRRLDLKNYDKIEKIEIPEEPVKEPVEPKKELKTEDNEKSDVPEPVIEEESPEVIITNVESEGVAEESEDAIDEPNEIEESVESIQDPTLDDEVEVEVEKSTAPNRPHGNKRHRK